jgi:glutamate formiminotransferase
MIKLAELTTSSLFSWQLREAACAVAVQALAAIDLSSHQATHPRLGSVDHISCHPIGPDASLHEAAALAHEVGASLSTGPATLPVYYYGAASKRGHSLAHIRRQLGECPGQAEGILYLYAPFITTSSNLIGQCNQEV